MLWRELEPMGREAATIFIRKAEGLEPQAALTLLRQAAKTWPFAAAIHAALASAAARRGLEDESKRHQVLALAADILAQGQTAKPGQTAELAHFAEWLLEAGYYDAATLAEETAFKAGESPEAFLAQAKRLLLASANAEAREALDKAVRLDPALAEAQLRFVRFQAEHKELEAAIERLFVCLKSFPGVPEFEIELALALRKAGRPTEAAAAFRRYLMARPDDAEALRGLSAAYRDLGDYQKALDPARRAIAIDPAKPWLHVQLGNLLAVLGHPAEAATAYRTALDLDLNLPGVARALGDQLLLAKDELGAAGSLSLAAAETSRDTGLMLKVAALYAGLGKLGEAIPWYRRALELGTLEPEREKQARQGLEAALTASPPSKEAKKDVKLADAIRRLPFLADGAGKLYCRPLAGGFQNAVFRVRGKTGDFALRLEKFPAARWDFYAEEARNAKGAHQAGIAPETLYVNEADGTMLTRFIKGSTLDYTSFLKPENLRRAGLLYRKLHAAPRFFGVYDIFRLIDKNMTKAGAAEVEALSGIKGLKNQLGMWRALLRANGVLDAPGHNDPIPGNFIDDGKELTLIDWQCSGMSDPHWDIGALAAQVKLTDEQEAIFFAAYFGDLSHPGLARARLYKAVCHAFWLTRALARKAEGEAEAEWQEDFTTSRERLLSRMTAPDWTDTLRGVMTYGASF